MKLCTFSGVSATLSGVNAGSGMIDLATHVVSAMQDRFEIDYSGTDDVDHFRSFVNYGTMLGQVVDAVRLSGSTVLNDEASRLAPKYAELMSNLGAGDPSEDILVLAHSQGTNNLTWTLLNLARNEPAFFENRSVRCALFDPKVGRNFMEQLFGLFPPETLAFLFFQSQNDVLGDQGMFIPKFIEEFPHGDHIWVKGLDHGSIREWDMLSKAQHWLNLGGYFEFSRAYGREIIRLRQETRGHLGTMQLLELDKWMDEYAEEEMNSDVLTQALTGFLSGKLLKKFKS